MKSRDTKARPFTISDAMILVAATAVGMAWAGSNLRQMGVAMKPFEASWDVIVQRAAELAVASIPCLICWNLAALVVRMRRPRPRWRRVVRQPGMAACLAALLPLVATFALIAAQMVRIGRTTGFPPEFWDDFPGSTVELFVFFSPLMGIAVVVAWFLMAVQRTWRGERSGIDRLGRLVGVLWIVLTLIMAVLFGWRELF